MADYRVYLLDTDGSFYSVVPLVCTDDGEANEHAQWLALDRDVELWQLDRKVAVIQDQNRSTEMMSAVMAASNDRKELERRLQQAKVVIIGIWIWIAP